MRQFFGEAGLDFPTMELGQPVPVEGWEVQTLDSAGTPAWKKVLRAVRKPNAPHMRVSTPSGLTLDCSPDHKLFVQSRTTKAKTYEDVAVLEQCAEMFVLRTLTGWEPFKVENVGGEIEIADIEVEGAHSYLSNGILSHNTLYGDPSTTPGGMAIPYHASVRIKLTGGQAIKQTINGKESVVGINVTCKTIKNKLARPWREVSFEIHFGKGIREAEQLFDELREFCDLAEKDNRPVIVNGKRVSIGGTAAWKTFAVSDAATGELVHEVKFNKSQFQEKVLDIPEFKEYLDGLMDTVFIMKTGEASHRTVASIDLSSAAEVEAVKVEKLGKAGKSLLMD